MTNKKTVARLRGWSRGLAAHRRLRRASRATRSLIFELLDRRLVLSSVTASLPLSPDQLDTGWRTLTTPAAYASVGGERTQDTGEEQSRDSEGVSQYRARRSGRISAASQMTVTASTPAVPGRLDVDLRTLPTVAPAPIIGVGDERTQGILEVEPQLMASSSRSAASSGGGPSAGANVAVTPAAFANPVPNFDGIVFSGSTPPDPVGDVGPSHYIQMVNRQFQVFDKSGNSLAGPFNINQPWINAGVGNLCLNNNSGDPYVVYDHLADRWVISQFAVPNGFQNPPFAQCIAVSQTADPVSGGWFLYEFVLNEDVNGNTMLDAGEDINGNGVLDAAVAAHDYPKLGLWPDGYYMSSQQGFPGGQLNAVAFDRLNMLMGNPATFQSATSPGPALVWLPSDLDGSAPPVGTPNFFTRHVDGDIWGGADRVEMMAFAVDWAVPANSTFTPLPSLVAAPFDAGFNNPGSLFDTSIPQPSPQIPNLDVIPSWPMGPLQYRSFGTHESLVFNHSVDVDGNAHAGVRWYELRRPAGGAWSIFQQGTHAPDEGNPGLADDPHRWLGSAAMDKAGNLAIGYTVSSGTLNPGIRYAGRLAGDPLGLLPRGEFSLIAGTGPVVIFDNQMNPLTRWGDYAAMRVDPVDDCTFWYTGEYGLANNAWATRIGAFRFPSCNVAPDQFEPNDTIQTATVLGSLPQITLRDVSIHDEQDTDFFKYTAAATGKLIVQALFDHADGNLDLSVRDARGNLLADSTSLTSNERIILPVVSQEMYFIQITGTDDAVNNYALEVENFAAPIPDFVDLPALDQNRLLNDTGFDPFDDVTFRTEPEILIEADLSDFADMGIAILTSAQAAALNAPGAAVEVFVNGNRVGFADPVAGTGNTLFRYTFLANQLPVQLFPADSQGWLHYVKAAVRMIDGQQDANGAPAPAQGRTLLSQPLQLVVDTTAPGVTAPDLLETSDSGVSNTDNVTMVNPPAFRGTAEHNSRIRIFANGVRVGEGLAGSDRTDNGLDQVGAWEVTVEPLKYGQFEIWADAEDRAGNISRSGSLRVVVDPFESNDQTAIATVLGSLPRITLDDILLHDPGDVDLFQYTAPETGKLIVNAFSPDAIELRVRDVHGNLMAVGVAGTVAPGRNSDQFVIPVVSQQRYFLEVVFVGAPPGGPFIQHVATYDLEIENFAAPLADFVDLPAKDQNDVLNDTGMDVFDNVTSLREPEILIEADLADFQAMGIPILAPADAGFGTLPGAAVEVFVNGNSVGFATEVPDKGRTLFRYRFPAGVLPQTNFPADSGGFLHFVKGAVRVFDGQRNAAGDPAPASARTPLSQPLLLRVDDQPPAATAPDLLAASDSGMFDDDNVTRIRVPAFQGTAEHNAKIRIFASNMTDPGNPGPAELVGQGTVGSDLTEDGFNQTGSWEITVEPLDDAVYDILAEVEDLAGNISQRAAVRIEVDTLAPNTPLVDLVEADDLGRHDDDNITSDNTPRVTMTSTDPNNAFHILFTDNLKFRLFDRFEENEEFLIYDSAQDATVDAVSTASDGLTSLQVITQVLAVQFVALNPGGNVAVTAAGELVDGIHHLKLEVEDRAGNISQDFLFPLLVDTAAFGGQPHLDPDSDTGIWGFPATMMDSITSDKTPTFFGTAEANHVVTVSIDGQPAGTAVSVPLDGDDAFQPPNPLYDIVQANWVVDTHLNLSDGEHAAVFTFEDPAGNRDANVEMPLLFFVDTQGPRITNVTYGDVSTNRVFTFDENTTSLFRPKPNGGPDPLISSIVIHLRDDPPRTMNFDYPALFQALAEEEGNYRVMGDANGEIPILSVNVQFDTPTNAVDRATATVELVFHDPGPDGLLYTGDDLGTPLPDDRFTLWVRDTLADPAGNPLDGESGALAPFAGNDVPADTPPTFPTGDGQHGGDFHARFTVDSRDEIGVWSAGTVQLDLNGDFVFDAANSDQVNRDISLALGLTSDYVFAGNFAGLGPDRMFGTADDTAADGYDKLAAYGQTPAGFRWVVTDTFLDPGVALLSANPLVGIPLAGNLDGDATNGDELSVFTGTNWWADLNRDGTPEANIASSPAGYPIVGDFTGNGVESLAVWDARNNTFTSSAFPSFILDVGNQFIGVRERPVAGDMDGDGIDDIGLWVPDRSTAVPGEAGEWYFFVSHGRPIADRVVDGKVRFRPAPFGHDIFAQFGAEFAVPVVGNFDPPVSGATLQGTDPAQSQTRSVPADDGLLPWRNPDRPLDVDDDGLVAPRDALMVIQVLNDLGPHQLSPSQPVGGDPVYLDVTGDGRVVPRDALIVIDFLSRRAKGEGEAGGSRNAEQVAGLASETLLRQAGHAPLAGPRVDDRPRGGPPDGMRGDFLNWPLVDQPATGLVSARAAASLVSVARACRLAGTETVDSTDRPRADLLGPLSSRDRFFAEWNNGDPDVDFDAEKAAADRQGPQPG